MSSTPFFLPILNVEIPIFGKPGEPRLGGGPVGILSGAPLAPHAEAVLALLRRFGADCGRGFFDA